MGDTSIEWTDKVWNPTKGCDQVSAGCDNCYAMTMAKRLKGMGAVGYQQDGDPRTSGPGFLAHESPSDLDWPLHQRKPSRIFVNSMSDLFHDTISDEYIARVWQVMGATPQHTYQVLTKRHARMRSWVTRWYSGEIAEPYDVRPVPGYPGYSVSTLGEVFGKRADTRGGLAFDIGEQGHRRVTMHRDGSPRSGSRELVHRLVLTAFARPARHGEQACHRNGDPADNRLSNLHWGTQEDNWQDRVTHGNGRSYQKLTEDQVSEIRAIHASGRSAYSIAKDYGVSDTQIRNIVTGKQWANAHLVRVPVPAPARVVLSNCWLGVSVEDQRWADIRIPALIDTPAAVRFLSCEPLLGPIGLFGDFEKPGPACTVKGYSNRTDYGTGIEYDVDVQPGIDWVIAGGESGPGARPMHPAWLRSLRDQCVSADVPYLFKQRGEWTWNEPGQFRVPSKPYTDRVAVMHPAGMTAMTKSNPFDPFAVGHPHWTTRIERVGKKAAGRLLDGRTWDEYPEPAHAALS
jgi:protein gp37